MRRHLILNTFVLCLTILIVMQIYILQDAMLSEF